LADRIKKRLWLPVFGFLVLAMTLTLKVPRPPEGAPRVLLLGDSITQGALHANRIPYRVPLWRSIREEYLHVNFVGSTRAFHRGRWPLGLFRYPRIDPHHEGHWGWESGEILEALPDWLPQYDFDIVLIHLGSNDIDRGQSVVSTIEEIEAIIELLREKNSAVHILLAQIIPMRGVDVTEFNAAIASSVASQNTETSPVLLVDQYSGYDVDQFNYDKYHPNKLGAERMAERWLSVMRPVIVSLSDKLEHDFNDLSF